jgi:hypothetical protein
MRNAAKNGFDTPPREQGKSNDKKFPFPIGSRLEFDSVFAV